MTDLDKKVKAATRVGRPKIVSPLSGSYSSGFQVEDNFRNIRLLRDEVTGAIIAIATVGIDAQQPDGSVDPVQPVRLVGGQGNANIASIITEPTGQGGVTSVAFGAAPKSLSVIATQLYWNAATAAFDVAEAPTNVVSVTATGAASTTILAAGGAGLKYRLFRLAFEVSTTAAVGEVTVNEITSGTIISQMSLGAAGSVANEIDFGPNGVLQPTANNGIQLTSLANATASVTLVYGVAR